MSERMEIKLFIKIRGRKTGYQNRLLTTDVDSSMFDEAIKSITPEIHKWIKEGK